MSDKLSDNIKHELELLLNENLIAFFSVCIEVKLLGDDNIELLPTITIFADNLTKEEKIKMATAIVELGKHIRDGAIRK